MNRARCRRLALLYGPAARCKPKMMIWRRLVLRFCFRPIDGALELLAIMDIRARSISFTTRPRRPEGPPDHERAGETFFSISSFRLADLGGKPPIAFGISLSRQPSLANLSEFIFQTAGFVMRAS